MIALTPDAIDVAALLLAVGDPEHGGTAVFLGTTRREGAGKPVRELRYDVYAELAEAEMRAIATEAEDRFAARVAMVHRTGTVGVGEPSVAVVASAGHRPAAFSACRFLIDELKARVPIWKQVVHEDGTTVWLDAAPPAS